MSFISLSKSSEMPIESKHSIPAPNEEAQHGEPCAYQLPAEKKCKFMAGMNGVQNSTKSFSSESLLEGKLLDVGHKEDHNNASNLAQIEPSFILCLQPNSGFKTSQGSPALHSERQVNLQAWRKCLLKKNTPILPDSTPTFEVTDEIRTMTEQEESLLEQVEESEASQVAKGKDRVKKSVSLRSSLLKFSINSNFSSSSREGLAKSRSSRIQVDARIDTVIDCEKLLYQNPVFVEYLESKHNNTASHVKESSVITSLRNTVKTREQLPQKFPQ
jgi:hypothetical protein